MTRNKNEQLVQRLTGFKTKSDRMNEEKRLKQIRDEKEQRIDVQKKKQMKGKKLRCFDRLVFDVQKRKFEQERQKAEQKLVEEWEKKNLFKPDINSKFQKRKATSPVKQKLISNAILCPRRSSRAGSSIKKKRRNPTPLKTPEKSETLQILESGIS